MLVLCFVFVLGIQLGTSQKEGELCVIKRNNESGICTPALKCLSAREDFINKGIRPTLCTIGTSNVLVCCNNGSEQDSPQKPFLESNNRNKRISEMKCDEYSRTVDLTPGPDGWPPLTRCDFLKCLCHDDPKPEVFPHMAALGWIGYEGNYVFNCSGSLISSRFVLTAAHCTVALRIGYYPYPSIVRLGDKYLDPDVDDGANPVDVPIKTIYKHPPYISRRNYNDIALIELNSTVVFTSAIAPACLWTKPDFLERKTAIASGWGAFIPRKRTLWSEKLLKEILPILENDFCNDLRKGTFHRYWTGFDDTQLCAGDLRGQKDTCQNDGGSPLQVISDENKCIFHIIGVNSFGRDCADADRPGVYTRVSSYLDWIETIVWPGE